MMRLDEVVTALAMTGPYADGKGGGVVTEAPPPESSQTKNQWFTLPKRGQLNLHVSSNSHPCFEILAQAKMIRLKNV